MDDWSVPLPVPRLSDLRATADEASWLDGEMWSGYMDVIKMLAELRQEREQLEEAILTLERLARGRGRQRPTTPLDE